MAIWTENQTRQVQALIQNAVNKGTGAEAYQEISQKVGKSIADVIEQAEWLHLPKLHYDFSDIIQQCIDIAPRNVQLTPQKFETEKAIIASDLHLPAVDWIAFDRMMSHSAGSDLFHAGDIMNNDALSPFHDVSASFRDEIETMQKVVKYWDKYFNSVTIIMGNHDNDWLRRATDGQMDLPLFVRMIEGKNIRIVTSTHCFVNDWFVCHPKEYSRVPLAVGIKLSNKYHMNVAGGHQHNVAWGTSPHGENVVDLGGLMSENSMVYSQYNSASNPVWSQGFMVMQGKGWQLLSNRNNWGEMGPL